MNLHLLDAGGAGLVYGVLIIFILFAVVAEAIVMLLMKYNRTGKSFLDSLIVNIASLVAGYILSSAVYLDAEGISYYLLLYGITVVIEAIVLYLLNRKHPIGKTISVSLVMNLVSYLILYFLFRGI